MRIIKRGQHADDEQCEYATLSREILPEIQFSTSTSSAPNKSRCIRKRQRKFSDRPTTAKYNRNSRLIDEHDVFVFSFFQN